MENSWREGWLSAVSEEKKWIKITNIFCIVALAIGIFVGVSHYNNTLQEYGEGFLDEALLIPIVCVVFALALRSVPTALEKVDDLFRPFLNKLPSVVSIILTLAFLAFGFPFYMAACAIISPIRYVLKRRYINKKLIEYKKDGIG